MVGRLPAGRKITKAPAARAAMFRVQIRRAIRMASNTMAARTTIIIFRAFRLERPPPVCPGALPEAPARM